MSEFAQPVGEPSRYGSRIGRWVLRQARNLAPFATLVLMVAFFALSTDSFLDLVNLRNILAQMATLAVVATGVLVLDRPDAVCLGARWIHGLSDPVSLGRADQASIA